jgi:hypothetical protein
MIRGVCWMWTGRVIWLCCRFYAVLAAGPRFMFFFAGAAEGKDYVLFFFNEWLSQFFDISIDHLFSRFNNQVLKMIYTKVRLGFKEQCVLKIARF